MVRVQVSSSSLASVGYDAAKQILEVEFNTGTIYQYIGVPVAVYEELMVASSHGTYFAHNIKNAGYLYHRIH